MRPREAPYKLFDAGCRGLHLVVSPTGSKTFRLRFWYAKREKTLSVGTYPGTRLAEAREKVLAARKLLADGIDPVVARKRERAEREAERCTFESLAREWHGKFSKDWTERHRDRVWRRIETNLLPFLGHRPVKDIEPPELLAVLRRMEARECYSLAHRVQEHASAIFRYGVSTGRALRNPAADLRGAIAPATVEHFPAITDPKEVGALLRAIDGHKGEAAVAAALKLAPLVFTRPAELRGMEWAEVDLDTATWRIPAERMKMNRAHVVPLSRQAVAILRDLQPVTGSGRHVFPSIRGDARPISENTLNAALRRLGYSKDRMTSHGFRTMASTLLNELGHKPDFIERQLAHQERNQVRAAYNRAEHLDERRTMMQAWADYLDGLKASGKVFAINRSA